MINRKDFLALNYYKKTCFYGSYKNMHYRISKESIEIPADESEKENAEPQKKDIFKVFYWPGPYIFDKTDDSLKQSAEFPFSEEGLCAVADFLNEQFEKQAELWKIDTMR